MASTFSTNLAIELIGTGDQAGTWGATTNSNLGTLIEQAISGYVTQAVVTGTDTTITIPNGSTGVARNMYIELTGTGGTNTNLIVPANKKLYFIFNNSTGAVTVKVSGQTGVSVPTGKKMVLVSNGTDIVNGLNYIADFGTNSFTVTNLTATSATITNLIATTASVSDLSATVSRSASATITNLIATSASITTVTNSPTFSAGTANGVAYLNGSKVLTTGSALVFDGTNLGVGVAASSAGRVYARTPTTGTAYYADNTTNSGFFVSFASALTTIGNDFSAPLAFAVNNAEQMRLTSTGLGIGTSSPSFSLDISNAAPRIRQVAATGTNSSLVQLTNSGGTAYIGLDNSTGGLAGAYSLNLFHSGAYPIAFSTSGTERMRLDSSGNLGIGTSSPAYKLAVQGSAYITSTVGIGTTPGNYGGQVDIYANSNAAFNGIWVRNDSSGSSANAGIVLNASGNSWRMAIGSSANNSNALFWAVDAGGSPLTRLTLDTSGNLGLGVTPSAWYSTYKALQVNTTGSLTSNTDFFAVSNNAFVNTSGGDIYLTTGFAGRYRHVASSGAHQWFTAPSGTAGNAISFTQAMTLDASGSLLVGATTGYSGFKVQTVNGNGFSVQNSAGTAQAAWFGAGGSIGLSSGNYAVINGVSGILLGINSTEAARIDSSGSLLVGTTNAAENAGSGMKVINTGGTVALVSTASDSSQQGFEMYSTTAGAYRLYINYAGTINATNTTISAISDQRLKENIQDIDVGLDAIMSLKPRKFDWKAGKGKDIKNDRGWIAQEFEQVFPDMIDEWRDPAPEGEEPYKSVRADLIPVLVKAIQELTARVAQLESK